MHRSSVAGAQRSPRADGKGAGRYRSAWQIASLRPSALAPAGYAAESSNERGGHDDQTLDMDSSGNPG
jgi:hypothetical protein